MIIDDKVFQQQFLKVGTSKQKPVNFTYKAEFVDENNSVIPVHNVLRLQVAANYIEHFSDVIFYTMDMFKSNYFKLLKTNRKSLMLRVTKTECSYTGIINQNATSSSRLYDVALTNTTSEAVETRPGKLTGTEWDDLGGFHELTVQLIERGLNEFRNWDVPARVYKNCNLTTLLQGFMSTPLKSLDPNMKVGYGCTIHPPDNDVKFFQRKIPAGIRIYKFPRHMQNTVGVYGNGLASYLSNSMWHVFPTHNVDRYTNGSKKMTIINVPRNEMMGNNNSYFLDANDDELYVYATGDTSHVDNSDRAMNKVGTGFTTVNPNNLLDGFVKNDKGTLVIPKGQNLMSVNFDSRSSDINNVKTSKPISGNRFNEASKITKSMVNTIVVTWEYSNTDLLYPGMPVKFIYKNGETAHMLHGVLAGHHTEAITPMQSVTDHRYKSTTQLILTVERASN
jgi:hypothetical protein